MGGGWSRPRLGRVRGVLERLVGDGFVPGGVVALARQGGGLVVGGGTRACLGGGAGSAWAGDTIWRTGSMTKPLVAACAMTLVEDGTLRLDGPVGELLPELTDMRVVADPDGPVEETVPARRAITLRDLLTYTVGTGIGPGTGPIADAVGILFKAVPPDEWIARFGALPLAHQPGERWMYEIAANVTTVLVARATGTTFGEALRERVCEPLGMTDTTFHVGEERWDRFATAYAKDGDGVVADAPDGAYSTPPVFESGGGGLVSTAEDYLAFGSALLNGGVHRGERVLSRPAVALMTTNHLTPEQREVSGFVPGYFDDFGWGFGMSVRTRRRLLGPSAGSFGWSGFWGTAWYDDPAEDLVAVVALQRAHQGDQALPLWDDVWTAIYQAIDD